MLRVSEQNPRGKPMAVMSLGHFFWAKTAGESGQRGSGMVVNDSAWRNLAVAFQHTLRTFNKTVEVDLILSGRRLAQRAFSACLE